MIQTRGKERQMQGTGFNVASCIVSFLITLGIAITGGWAALGAIWFIFVVILYALGVRGPDQPFVSAAICTAIVYPALFAVVWWAIYNVMNKKS